MIDLDLQDEFRPHLNANERLVWAGRPKTGILFRPSDKFLIPFSIFFGGIAIFWEILAFVTGAPLFFKLWGIPFVIIGLYMLVGRFLIDAGRRASTIYGLTNERLIIRSGILRKDMRFFYIRSFAGITLYKKPDNSGSIDLEPTDFRYSMMKGMDWPGVKQPLSIEFVEDVQSVYNKILDLQKQLSGSEP